MILDQKLDAGDVIILDGATGTEIARRGATLDNASWAGLFNKTHPELVREVHEDYVRAGADIITANTFATHRHVLDGAGLGDESVAMTQRGIELAFEARDRVAPDRPVAVAGSMSSMLAWSPGSLSPDPRFIPSAEQESANFREMATTLAEGGVDFIVMEMMLELEHAPRAISAALSTGLPVWIGISCSQLPDGGVIGWNAATERFPVTENGQSRPCIPLETILDQLLGMGGNVAGIMHSSVSSTSPALEALFKHWSGPVMAYPETAKRANNPGVAPADFATHCRQWVDDGVQIIGGCCGATIEHIREMVDGLPKRPGVRH